MQPPVGPRWPLWSLIALMGTLPLGMGCGDEDAEMTTSTPAPATPTAPEGEESTQQPGQVVDETPVGDPETPTSGTEGISTPGITADETGEATDGVVETPTAAPTPTVIGPVSTPTPTPTQTPPAIFTPTPMATPEMTVAPTAFPTVEPTAFPTAEPTPEPTAEPTPESSAVPTSEPSAAPTSEPTAVPTAEPTALPTATPATPTAMPATPTATPTAVPTPTAPVDGDGDGVPFADDCDDEEPSTFPGADEACDGVDNDCDGDFDEGAMQTFYEDKDGDGFGDAQSTSETCAVPPGYVSTAGDCDDDDAQSAPDAHEICDGVDNDCDGELIPCSIDLDFTDAEDFGHFVSEAEACTVDESQAGTLGVNCPVGSDAALWFDMEIPETATSLRVESQLLTGIWFDGAPRIGFDVGEGLSPWGALEGYGFSISDPLDAEQGNRCQFSDACPSITQDGAEILAILDRPTYPGREYELHLSMGDDGVGFDIIFDNDGQPAIYSLGLGQAAILNGKVALHCGETSCQFQRFFLAIE